MTKALTIRMPWTLPGNTRRPVKAIIRERKVVDDFILPRPAKSYKDPERLAKEISNECLDSQGNTLSYGVPLSCVHSFTITLPERKWKQPVKVIKCIHALLSKHEVRNPSFKTKEKLMRLDFDTLMEFALEQEVPTLEDVTTFRNKSLLVSAIWEHNLSYDHRSKVYKAQEELFSIGNDMGKISIRKKYHFRKVFNLLRINRLPATMDSLQFERGGHSYGCEYLWCLGLEDNRIFFCAIPCCSTAKLLK